MNTSKPLPPPASDPNRNLVDPPTIEEKPRKIDISLSQVVGGALAAMTAAALGSRLGVAGTITGAAVASVVAGIASSLYTASLRHTQEKVKTVWSGRIVPGERSSSAEPTGDRADPTAGIPLSVDVVPEEPAWELPHEPPRSPLRSPRRRFAWKPMLVGAVAAFAIAAVALTGFELITGRALSGGQGTTIAQVREEHQPTKKASNKATPSKSATPSSSASATPSDSPSRTPQAAPSDTPTGAESTAPTTQQPTTRPSETSQPSAASGAQTASASSSATATPVPEKTPAG